MEVSQIFSGLVNIKQEIYRGKAKNIPIGERRSPFIGSGYDIRDIKEWQPGDPLENIDLDASLLTWPERIFILEELETKNTPVVMVIDVSPSMFIEIDESASRFKLLLDLIGTLGLSANYFRDPAGALCYSDEIKFYLPPRLGLNWLLYVTQSILDEAEEFKKLKRQGKITPQRFYLNLAMNFLICRFGCQQCAIVILSDFADIINGESEIDYKIIETLSALHNWNIIAIFLDDLEEFRWYGKRGFVPIKNVETGEIEKVKAGRAAKIRQEFSQRREELRKRLENVGVDSLVLNYGDHFNQLAQFLAERKTISR